MNIEIVEESAEVLPAYATVPISFLVRSRLRVVLAEAGLGGMTLIEEKVDTPYLKEYDQEGNDPVSWASRWELDNWGILSAFSGSERVGGGVVAWRTAGVNMLEGRDDLAVLWDLRVHPEYRRKGIGRRLMDGAADWARGRGCVALKIETQNINVSACRFYAQQGCELGAINRWAYPDLPDEVQMLWYLDLQKGM